MSRGMMLDITSRFMSVGSAIKPEILFGVDLYVQFGDADKVACLVDIECSPPREARNLYCGTSQNLLRQRAGVVADVQSYW